MTGEGKWSEQEPLHVLSISPGIVLGPVHLLDGSSTPNAPQRIAQGQFPVEWQRLQAAIAAAEQELDVLHTQVMQMQKAGQNEAEIFTAQKFMLRDPDLLDEVEALMTQQFFSAEAAWSQVTENQSKELAALADPTLAARALDVRDMAVRVLYRLQVQPDRGRRSFTHQQEPVLLVAYDLLPSQTAELDPASILGICTVEGGPTTHAAIIARSLEIPAVAGLDKQVFARLSEGEELAIDGEQGLVYLQPQGEQRIRLQAAMEAAQRTRHGEHGKQETRWRSQTGKTADGQAVLVYANIGDAQGAREAAERGAQGIGLLRTEFLFGQRAIFPDEREQIEGYLAVFKAFAEHAGFQKTLVARTLDAGADKPFPALAPLLGDWQEANPALGLRGARIHLLHEDLLRQQLRALLLAAGETDIQLQIMFPMITTVEETRRLKQTLRHVQDQLRQEGARFAQNVQVGIMIETPAAVWMADALAREVDFFSIGANDLFQYTMAADRTNSRVMQLFGPLEPALWRAIHQVVRAGQAHQCLVAVCGEIAGDPHYGPLLVGLGVQELSVSPPLLTRVKAALHQHEMAYWQRKAQALLQAETAAEINVIIDREG
jgi:phosphoenolpyruvate-protein phosphotransferase